MNDDLSQLLANRLDALYIQDTNNRLLRVNEPDTTQKTPYLAVMRSKQNLAWRVRYDVPNTITEALHKVFIKEPNTSDFQQVLTYQEEYQQILSGFMPITTIYSGPAYILPDSLATERTVLITDNNTEFLAEHFPYTLEIIDFRRPITAVIIDNTAVAVCFCARKTEHVAEAGVFTLEEYRKRGYASLVVNDWAIVVRQEGLTPLYSTSDDNKASQSVANKLGAIQFATDFSFY